MIQYFSVSFSCPPAGNLTPQSDRDEEACLVLKFRFRSGIFLQNRDNLKNSTYSTNSLAKFPNTLTNICCLFSPLKRKRILWSIYEFYCEIQKQKGQDLLLDFKFFRLRKTFVLRNKLHCLWSYFNRFS